MNLHKIKINGTTEIDSEIDDKLDYSVVLKRCAVKSVKRIATNNDDGYVYTYNLENLDIATLISEGKTINGKAKSQAKKLRGRIFMLGQDEGVEDEETFYEQTTNKLIAYLPEILEYLKDKQ